MLIKKIIFLSIFSVFTYAISFDFKSFRADFKQIVFDNQNILEYSGKIFYKDKKSLWQYLKPDEKKVYINEKEVVIIDDDLEQVIFSTQNIDLSKILSQINEISKDKYIANYDNKDYYITCENDFIKTIEYKDELENKVRIVFSNSKLNLDINDELFEYIIPKDYDVIR